MFKEDTTHFSTRLHQAPVDACGKCGADLVVDVFGDLGKSRQAPSTVLRAMQASVQTWRCSWNWQVDKVASRSFAV